MKKPHNMDIAELTAFISQCNSLLESKIEAKKQKRDPEDDFFEFNIGSGRNSNLDPDTKLLITSYAGSSMVVFVPVVINSFSVKGKPYEKKKYRNGRLVTTSDGTPVTEKTYPHIVGRTRISSSTIPFRDGSLTGFASLQVSPVSPDDIEDRIHRTLSGTSLQVRQEITGAEPGKEDLERKNTEKPALVAEDETDDITTTHEFDPSDARDQ